MSSLRPQIEPTERDLNFNPAMTVLQATILLAPEEEFGPVRRGLNVVLTKRVITSPGLAVLVVNGHVHPHGRGSSISPLTCNQETPPWRDFRPEVRLESWIASRWRAEI